MPIDVVTAVHLPHARFVADTWASVRGQSRRDWTWVVQVDGPPEAVTAALEDCGAARHPQVRVDVNGIPAGPAVTRNVALGRSSAPLVQNLDADDILEPDALATLSSALEADMTLGYAFGRARDLLPDSRLVDHPTPLTEGSVPQGTLAHLWETAPAGHRLPAHPAGVMWRRALLVDLGGWPALETMEDTGLLLAASARSAGHFVDRPILRYRKHPGQSSANPSAFRGGEHKLRSFDNGSRVDSRGPGRRCRPALRTKPI
jgi:glycosyltransferase involved in cell wall biosynthesis